MLSRNIRTEFYLLNGTNRSKTEFTFWEKYRIYNHQYTVQYIIIIILSVLTCYRPLAVGKHLNKRKESNYTLYRKYTVFNAT
jgi:hypothetical protein